MAWYTGKPPPRSAWYACSIGMPAVALAISITAPTASGAACTICWASALAAAINPSGATTWFTRPQRAASWAPMRRPVSSNSSAIARGSRCGRRANVDRRGVATSSCTGTAYGAPVVDRTRAKDKQLLSILDAKLSIGLQGHGGIRSEQQLLFFRVLSVVSPEQPAGAQDHVPSVPDEGLTCEEAKDAVVSNCMQGMSLSAPDEGLTFELEPLP